MKSRILSTLLILTTGIFGRSQTNFRSGEITDLRDGQTYRTIEIENTIWLAENLKYKTENSYSPSLTEEKGSLEGNYYPYEETNKVCPKNFRIPKLEDWEAYIKVLLALKNIPNDSMEYFTDEKKKFSGGKDLSNKVQFFAEPNPLNLHKSGYIQGIKLKALGSFNSWVRKQNLQDAKYHVHLVSDGYLKHTHKHHINNKKRKKRKFVVRCVKDKLVE